MFLFRWRARLNRLDEVGQMLYFVDGGRFNALVVSTFAFVLDNTFHPICCLCRRRVKKGGDPVKYTGGRGSRSLGGLCFVFDWWRIFLSAVYTPDL